MSNNGTKSDLNILRNSIFQRKKKEKPDIFGHFLDDAL